MTSTPQVQSLIETLEQDSSLFDPKNFDERTDALELIEFYIAGSLKTRAEALKGALEEIDQKLFEKLRGSILSGQCRGQAFVELISEYFDLNEMNSLEEGYDNLDIFINCLFHIQQIPEQTKELLPEMVFYQKTPARVVFEMVRKVQFTEDDIFVDIGSGLGQVAILVNLIAGIPANGIEYEPAFCEFSTNCAVAVNLFEVTFINADAREADYSRGTIFFLYTPFKGEMLKQVLVRLREQATRRQIRVITYGPCTKEIRIESWLNVIASKDTNNLAVFISVSDEELNKHP